MFSFFVSIGIDLKKIFKCGDALGRLNYISGSLIVLLFLFCVAAIGSSIDSLSGGRSGYFLILSIVFNPLGVAYLLFFRLRRIVDLGASSKTSALVSIIVVGLIAIVAGLVHPYAKFAIVVAFELMLLLATGGSTEPMKRDVTTLPTRDWDPFGK